MGSVCLVNRNGWWNFQKSAIGFPLLFGANDSTICDSLGIWSSSLCVIDTLWAPFLRLSSLFIRNFNSLIDSCSHILIRICSNWVLLQWQQHCLFSLVNVTSPIVLFHKHLHNDPLYLSIMGTMWIPAWDSPFPYVLRSNLLSYLDVFTVFVKFAMMMFLGYE